MSVQPRWTWGLAAVWTFVLIGVFIAAQGTFAAGYVLLTTGAGSEAEIQQTLHALETDGDLLALGSLISTPICLLALLAVVKLKRGATLADSLALHRTQPGTLLRWMAFAVVFCASLDLLNWMLGRPIVPEFMRTALGSADSKLLLVFAVVVAAPVFEELLFRGFLMTALESSPAPAWLRVAGASLVWTGLHVQYGAFDMASVFALGLLLGAARVRTGSLAAPIAMHILMNAIATAETAYLLGR